MKRSIFCVLFVLMLLVGLLTVSVGATEATGTAADTHTDHCVCGGHAVGVGSHTCEDLTWQAWTDEANLPTQSGNYYLTVDVTLGATKTIAAGNTVNLCLNGHTVTSNTTRVYSVKGSWNLTDCGAESEWGAITAKANSTYGGIAYVYESTSSVGIYGGKLSTTGTYVWGGLFMVQNGTLNLYDGDLQGGYGIRKHVTSSNDDRDGRGASVYMMAGTFNMYGGTISGGTVQNAGGNVMIIGTNTKFNMYGGTITGGTVDPDLGTMMDGAAPWGGNVALLGGTTTITGGTITGGTAALGGDIYVASSVKAVTVSGEVTIGDVYVDDGASFTIDALKDSVGISNSHTTHCLCVGNGVGKGEHDCETVEEWIPWGYLSAERSSLPATSGKYYLVSAITLSSSNKELPANKDISLCLNGYKITQSVRINAKGNLTLTDCKGTGLMESKSSGSYGGLFYLYNNAKVVIYAGTYDASKTTVRNGGFAHIGNDKAAYLDIYGGRLIGATLTVSETATNDPRGTKGGILDITVSSVVNMYGGSLEGGSALVTSETTQTKNRPMGGCVALYSGTFNMYGGTISGGEAVYGGCIYYRAGTLNIVSGTISGGKATYGGNIYAEPAVTLSGGTISNGESADRGGNVYGAKAVTLSGATLTGGVAGNTMKGGSIYTASTFTMTSGSITGGRVDGTDSGSEGGCVYAKDFSMSGGTIFGGLTEEQIAAGLFNARNGGCVAASTSIVISGGTISGGHAFNGGGNVYIPSGKTLTIEDSDTLITHGCAKNGGNVYGIKANITIQSGAQITYGNATGSGGNIMVTTAGGKLTIDGATLSNGTAKSGGGNLRADSGCEVEILGNTLITKGTAETSTGGNVVCYMLTMKNGTISDGQSNNQGGNLYVPGGSFTMEGGTITGGKSMRGSGGNMGVYASSSDTIVTLSGGTISNGTTPVSGGNMVIFTNADTDFKVDLRITGDMQITGGVSKATASGGGGNIALNDADCHLTIGEEGKAGPTISGGKAALNGGNIFSKSNNVILYSGTISGDLEEANAVEGGAIYIESGSVTIAGGTITGCEASGHGGGIFAAENATVTISGGTLSGNMATGSGANGGNLCADGAVTISGGTFENGSAVNAGGNICVLSATVTGGTFLGGSAKYGGNAAFTSGGDSTIQNATFTGGEAQTGGAVYASNDSITFTDVTISGGKANWTKTDSNGGNLYSKSSAITLTNCTISGGTATYRGGNIYASNGISITGGSITGGIAEVGEGEKVTTNGGNVTVLGGGSISGVTISDGQATHGGNLAVNEGTYTIENCIISNGKATLRCDGTTNGNGGNLYAIGNSIVTVTGCSFTGGEASRGGSIAAWGVVTIGTTTVDGGHSTVGGGNIMTHGVNSSLTLNAGTVLKNGSADENGGALFLSSGDHVHTINDGVQIHAGQVEGSGPCVYLSDCQLALNGAPEIASIHVYSQMEEHGLIVSGLTVTEPIPLLSIKPVVFGYGTTEDLSRFVSGQGYTLACRNGRLYLDAPIAVYVSDNGSDSNCGSQEAPYKTLNHALSMLADKGTIFIKDVLTQTANGSGSGGWAEHGKTFTLSGGEFVTPVERIYVRDNVTFDNMRITMRLSENNKSENYGSFFFYCNGFTTVFDEDVTTRYYFEEKYMDDSYQSLTWLNSDNVEKEITGKSKLYGGSNASVYGVLEQDTNLTVLGGVWGEIYGGSNRVALKGNARLTVGGNVNAGVDYVSHTHSGWHVIYGGSDHADIEGTVYMYVTGGQNHTSTFGGSNGTCSIGAVELHATGGNGMAIYGGSSKTGVNTIGTVNFYYEGATFEQVFGGSISQNLIVTNGLNLYVTSGTITRRLYGGCWVNREESILGDWDPQRWVEGEINLYIGADVNITCDLKKPDGDTYNDRGIWGHTRYEKNAAEEKSRIIFLDQAAYNKHKGKLKACDWIMDILMSGMTAADYICYMGTSVNGNTITVGATEVEDHANNALDLASTSVTLNVEDSYIYKGQAIEPEYTLDGAEDKDVTVSYVDNDRVGTGTVTLTYGGETLTFDFAILDGKVATVNGTVYYYLQEALDAAGEMGLVVLAGNTDESAEVKTNLYLDLNGHSIGGVLTVAEGMTLYGVDSTTNDYDCTDGYGTIAKVIGNVALHHKTEKNGALGRILRYLTYTDPETEAVSFHRIYLGITKVTLRPGKSGVGYKAIFGGDEVVKSMLSQTTAYGYTLQLLGKGEPVSRFGERDAFAAGSAGMPVSLVVSNYDMSCAEDTLIAWVNLTLNDGTVIESSTYEFTFKDILQKVDDQIDLYSQQQLEGLKKMISTIADQLSQWGFTNLYQIVTATTDPATPAPSKEEI